MPPLQASSCSLSLGDARDGAIQETISTVLLEAVETAQQLLGTIRSPR